VVVCPSDHVVADDDAFAARLRDGAAVARRTGRLVAFGVVPTRPDPGYGYLEPGAERDGFRELARFHEKPDRAPARKYLARGFRWNAGVFAWRASAFLDAARDSPLAPLVDALDRDDPPAGFEAAPALSVDEAVMEDAAARGDVATLALDVGWDDLGTWDAVGRQTDGENAALTDLEAVDATDNIVAGDAHVPLVGVDGLAVVAVDDRVLVVSRERANDVRTLVARLRERGRY